MNTLRLVFIVCALFFSAGGLSAQCDTVYRYPDGLRITLITHILFRLMPVIPISATVSAGSGKTGSRSAGSPCRIVPQWVKWSFCLKNFHRHTNPVRMKRA